MPGIRGCGGGECLVDIGAGEGMSRTVSLLGDCDGGNQIAGMGGPFADRRKQPQW